MFLQCLSFGLGASIGPSDGVEGRARGYDVDSVCHLVPLSARGFIGAEGSLITETSPV